MIGSILLSCQKTYEYPEMQDYLIRFTNGPSDNLLSVHDRLAIQGRVLPKPVSYFPAAPNPTALSQKHGI
jgi:hypothetical protein